MSGIVHLPSMGGGTDFTDGYVFYIYHSSSGNPININLKGSGVLCMASIPNYHADTIIIQTEKNKLTFINNGSGTRMVGITMKNDYFCKAISTSAYDAILQTGYYRNTTEYNYKQNPTIDVNQYEYSNFYCNPPIAFNDYIKINCANSDDSYAYIMILYKPK